MNSKINITTISMGQPLEFKLTEKDRWVGELLSELCEDLTQKELEELPDRPYLTINGWLTRVHNPQFKEHVLIDGTLQTLFGAQCTRSGKPMLDSMKFQINGVIIEGLLCEDLGYSEETELFVGEQMRELFCMSRNFFDLKEIVHELLYLMKNPYPSMDT